MFKRTVKNYIENLSCSAPEYENTHFKVTSIVWVDENTRLNMRVEFKVDDYIDNIEVGLDDVKWYTIFSDEHKKTLEKELERRYTCVNNYKRIKEYTDKFGFANISFNYYHCISRNDVICADVDFKQAVILMNSVKNEKYYKEYKDYVFGVFKQRQGMYSTLTEKVTAEQPRVSIKVYEDAVTDFEINEVIRKENERIASLAEGLDTYLEEINNELSAARAEKEKK